MRKDRWWSWKAEHPAEVRHFKSGLILTPILYAASENNVSRLLPGKEVSFGFRPIGDDQINLDFDVSGTKLSWRYTIHDDGHLSIDWKTNGFGEWGLRFWVVLCFHREDEAEFEFSRETNQLTSSLENYDLQVSSTKAALMTTFHDDLDGIEKEFQEHGYFYLASRGTHGKFAAMRFNLEEAPEMHVEASLVAKGQQHPEFQPAYASFEKHDAGKTQQALEAVHDVMSWNHVHDFINDRPYTALSRFWNTQKFGGFGVWLDDILYNAWCWSYFSSERTIDNLDAVFAWQTDAGNFPCLVTGNDAWVDRTQPPIASYVIWCLYLQSGRADVLGKYYAGLLRNYKWWWERRQLGDTGLLAFGTSLDAGDGLYKGTKLAAKDESTMDNSPLHDPVPFDEETGMLLAADVGMNSMAAIDGEVLIMMAEVLGHADDLTYLRENTQNHKERIADWLWDDERGVFANRMWDGTFVPGLAPTSFYPMAAGIGSPEQVQSMITEYLDNPDKFGGPIGLPSVTRDDPAYHDNTYWRGRVWGPLNFWAYQGLRRANRDQDASALSEKSWKLFEKSWSDRLCGENFHAETGAVHDQPDTDGFYAWGSLMPAIAVSEVVDFTPWSGWSMASPKSGERVGPFVCPAGQCSLTENNGVWTLVREDGSVVVETNISGRLSHVEIGDKAVRILMPIIANDDQWISFPEHGVSAKKISISKNKEPHYFDFKF